MFGFYVIILDVNGVKQKNACIDLGSNMCRLLIGKPDPTKALGFSIVSTYAVLVSLGKNETFINQKSVNRAIAALKKCKSVIDQHQDIQAHCMATAIFRSATNSNQVLDEIYNACKIEFKIVDPGEEIMMSGLGALDVMPNGFNLVMDMGGGSTEIGLFHKEKNNLELMQWTSIPCGLFFFSVPRKSTQPICIDSHKCFLSFIRSTKSRIGNTKIPMIICRSGIMSVIGNYIKHNHGVPQTSLHGYSFERDTALNLITNLAELSNESMLKQKLVSSKYHLNTIKGMSYFTLNLLNKFPVEQVILCNGGVKEGMMHLACKQ
jgi:exopolyphosphatase/guanosine-5'-triphosphate,3'-diphosphate pyrophosphatase